MEKRDNEIFMQSPGRRYLAMRALASCRSSAQSNQQYQWEDRFNAIEQENKGVAQAERKIPFFNQERGPPSLAIGKAQILCFAGLYTGGTATGRHVIM